MVWFKEFGSRPQAKEFIDWWPLMEAFAILKLCFAKINVEKMTFSSNRGLWEAPCHI